MKAGAPDLAPLTSIRGVAAWMVVLFHIRASLALPTPAIAVLAKGYLAVDLFFMLSGFVMWLNYADRLRAGGLAEAPAFLCRRIARIWPLHLFVLAGGVAFALLLVARGTPDPIMYPFAELPLHAGLMQNWGFTAKLAWNHPAWSISCELVAYLLFPLLCLAVDWRRLPGWTLIAMLGGLAVALNAVFSAAGHTSLGNAIPQLGVIRCLIEFGMGTMVCALWQRSDRPMLAGGALVCSVCAWAFGALEPLIVPIVFAALLFLLASSARWRGNPLALPLFVRLGEISYATYLVHFLLWIAFKLFFVNDVANLSWSLIGLFLLLTLGLSELLHRLVELPAQRTINGWLASRATPSMRERTSAAAG